MRRFDGGRGLIALGLGALFALVATWITWAEHETYNSTSLDIAVYSQLAWNIANGHPFETTLLLENRLHLAEHQALLLLPLAPLHGLVGDVRLLLLLQQAALGLSGLPIYWLARRRLGPSLALLPVAGYYLMPTLTEVALDAFYPIVFAAVPVGWAAALAVAGRARAAAVLALLAIVIEEEAALTALGVGLYLLLRCREGRRVGLAVLLTGGLWLGLAEGVIMPRFHQPTTAGDETRAEDHFAQLRTRPLTWLGEVAAHRLEPEVVRGSGLARLAGPPPACQQAGQCSALRWWLYPTAGLAMLSPTTLLMVGPPAAALLLADKPGRFRRHWAAPMLPVIWLAATLGLGHLTRRRTLLLAGAAALGLAVVLFYRLDSSLPLGSQYEPDDVVLSPLGADLRRLGGRIPDGASVTASRRGLAHLANRRELYAFPPKDYGPGLWPPRVEPEYALLDLRNHDTVAEVGTLDGYREVERTPNSLLLRRGGP